MARTKRRDGQMTKDVPSGPPPPPLPSQVTALSDQQPHAVAAAALPAASAVDAADSLTVSKQLAAVEEQLRTMQSVVEEQLRAMKSMMDTMMWSLASDLEVGM